MSQKVSHSWLEASLNTMSGFILSYITGLLVYPLFGFNVSAAQNFWIVMIYTIISILRTFIWRRLFNHHQVRNAYLQNH